MALTLDGTSGITLPTWTTAGRPTNPQAGQMGLNTTLGYIEWYSGVSWIAMNQSSIYNINYLVVAGGGGGGAGGLLNSGTALTNGIVYTITIGAGGVGVTSDIGTQGGNSVISGSGLSTITAVGGGYGGYGTNTGTLKPGGNGGSGGGKGGYANTPGKGIYPGSTYISAIRQGYDGGGGSASGGGGGGGGAGAAGSANSSQTGGAGGAGLASSISGTSVTYAGGGGGGGTSPSVGGAGGAGGGGAGGIGGSGTVGTSGTANTGGGGGGGGDGNAKGGDGGSGIVIISYTSPTQRAAGGTVTSYLSGDTTYWVHTFTTSGTFIA